jgi:uncharacterized membrane protein (DUF373 family)
MNRAPIYVAPAYFGYATTSGLFSGTNVAAREIDYRAVFRKAKVAVRIYAVRVFEASEFVLYSVVAILLVVIAIISILGELKNITTYLANNTPILGLQDLLNTIIILELLMTFIGYVKRESINLGLLLGAGLTATIRNIITVSTLPLPFRTSLLHCLR